jgi:hypothetical protein
MSVISTGYAALSETSQAYCTLNEPLADSQIHLKGYYLLYPPTR